MSYQGVAFLLLPAEPGLTGTIVETDVGWSLPDPPVEGTAVVVWGRGPLLSGTRPPAAARSAFARERALRAIRGSLPSFQVAGLHRLPPPVLAVGRVRNRFRRALLGGAVVELWSPGRVRRVIDAVAQEAQGGAPVTRLISGSGGSALVRLRGKIGGEVLLRAARANDPADPHRPAEALATLAPLGLKQIPRLLGQGRVAGASWSTESMLPGHRPARVSAPLALELSRLCAGLPRSERPATAHELDLRAVADRFPRWATLLSQVADEVTDVARAVPSVTRHGDLWAGNLLVRRQRLTGVLDWDAWHPSALPGVDLLHLLATDEGIRTHRGLGEGWLRRPWTSQGFRSATTEYWTSMRIVPNARFLGAVGIAWWATHVAASIRRLPRLADDGRWVASNVEAVLDAVSAGG